MPADVLEHQAQRAYLGVRHQLQPLRGLWPVTISQRTMPKLKISALVEKQPVLPLRQLMSRRLSAYRAGLPTPALRGWLGWLGKPRHSRDQRLPAYSSIYQAGRKPRANVTHSSMAQHLLRMYSIAAEQATMKRCGSKQMIGVLHPEKWNGTQV